MLYVDIYTDIFLALQRETPKLSLSHFLLDVDQEHFQPLHLSMLSSSGHTMALCELVWG